VVLPIHDHYLTRAQDLQPIACNDGRRMFRNADSERSRVLTHDPNKHVARVVAIEMRHDKRQASPTNPPAFFAAAR
jgi:hypothetical protein